jgi:hypothetical protein
MAELQNGEDIMKMHLLAAIVLAASIGLSSNTYAAPVDFIDNGDYTTDTLSSLDWLDVTNTLNLSHVTVQSYIDMGAVIGGVDYSSWKFASVTQFIQLVNNYTDSSTITTGRVSQEVDKVTGLINLLGNTSPVGQSNFDYTLGLLHEDSPFSGLFISAILFDLIGDPAPGSDQSDFSQARYHQAIVQNNVGSFLIRASISVSPVPIPAAAFMFAPALLGFMGLRRKAKNSAV